MSASKPIGALEADPVLAALENAPPLEQPLTAEEIEAIQAAMREPDPAVTSADLLARLRPKP